MDTIKFLTLIMFTAISLATAGNSKKIPTLAHHDSHKIIAKRTVRLGFAKYIKNIGKNGQVLEDFEAEFLVGSDLSKPIHKQSETHTFVLDFEQRETYIGLKNDPDSQADFGIEKCSKETHCIVDKKEKKKDFCVTVHDEVEYYHGAIVVPLPIVPIRKKTKSFKVRFVTQDSQKWIIGKKNILGLAPNSRYLQWLFNEYSSKRKEGAVHNVSFRLHLANYYSSISSTMNGNPPLSRAKVQINLGTVDLISKSKYPDEDFEFNNVGGPERWAVSANLSFNTFQNTFQSGKACFFPTHNSLLIFREQSDYDTMLIEFNNSVCGEDDCGTKAKRSNAPHLQVGFYQSLEKTGMPVYIPLEPQFYMTSDSEKLNKLGRRLSVRIEPDLAPECKFGFGSAFFGKVDVHFQLNKDYSTSVVVYRARDAMDWNYVLIEVPSFMAICCVIWLPLFVYNYKKQMKKKKEHLGDDESLDEDDSYEAMMDSVID